MTHESIQEKVGIAEVAPKTDGALFLEELHAKHRLSVIYWPTGETQLEALRIFAQEAIANESVSRQDLADYIVNAWGFSNKKM